MHNAEVRVDLHAIRNNVATLRTFTTAEIMAVVKADGYGHGMVRAARAALEGGATWLGVTTLDEALALRAADIDASVLCWLLTPGQPLVRGVAAGIHLSAADLGGLGEVVAAAREAQRPASVHLKIDTGLGRGGAAPADWPELVVAAAKAVEEGDIDVVGVWSHLANADVPDHPSNDAQVAAFVDALGVAEAFGITPRVRHLANSAATLTRPDTHFDLVRPGIAVYGLSPVEGQRFGLRPAMSVRARVMLAKRLPAGQGISYGHHYVTKSETTVAVVPIGYADGVPRAASGQAPVRVNGQTFPIAGRVCMDQIVLDVGDLPVRPGDEAVLFGGGDGEPHVDEWAAVCGTINYEIVARMGSNRTARVYVNG